ncbi:MAG: phage holin family protein [Microthrixaceae bacterium]|nr:phage holin family protein [Microthrixaceae bacterium]
MAESFKPRTQSGSGSSGPGTQINELKNLVVGYAKQETVDPLKTLGRYLGFGIAGSVCMGIGVSFLLLALLRGLQELEIFNDPDKIDGGTFSWAPYLITGAVGVIIAALFIAKLASLLNKQEKR